MFKNKLLFDISKRNIPNLLTLFAICIGLTGLRFSLEGNWVDSAIFIMSAALLDGLDGYIARKFNFDTVFGAQLDSFADFVNFGVAPALLIYVWNLKNLGALGWLVTLIYILSTALRLARFNSNSITKREQLPLNRFQGIPSPAAAISLMAPLFLTQQFFINTHQNFPSAYVAIWSLIISGLMVSKLPTYSLKDLNVNLAPIHKAIFFITLIIFCACLAFVPWLTLTLSIIGYLTAVAFNAKQYKTTGRQH